jgi:hypothetical protein
VIDESYTLFNPPYSLTPEHVIKTANTGGSKNLQIVIASKEELQSFGFDADIITKQVKNNSIDRSFFESIKQ